MDEDLDLLFHEAVHENSIETQPSFVEKIISKAEEEFKGYSLEEQSRQDEEAELKEKLKKLKKSLRQAKNIRNPRLQHLNKQRSEKRRKLKREIAECQLRLQEIDMERPKKD